MPPSHVIKQNANTSLRDKWPQAIGVGAIVLSVFCIHVVLLETFAMILQNFLPQTAAVLISCLPIILAGQFFGMPLLYGALRWFWFSSLEADVPISEVFCYFSDGREYLRAISLSFRVFVRIVGILFLCFLPTLLIEAARSPYTYQLFHSSMPYWVSSIWAFGRLMTLFGTVLSVILLLRYFAAPILMINDPSISPQEALNLSVIISKNANGKTLGFLFSFFGWYLLSLLVVPLLYIIPYFLCSYAVYCRYLINHYNRTVSIPSAAAYPHYPNMF